MGSIAGEAVLVVKAPLEDATRYAGVALAFIGVVLGNKEMAPHLSRRLAQAGRRIWARLLRLEGNVHQVAGSAQIWSGSMGSVTVHAASGSFESLTVEERIARLETGLQDLAKSTRHRFEQARSEADAREVRAEEHRQGLAADVRALEQREEDREAESSRWDWRVAPLLATSVVLTGIPELIGSLPWFFWGLVSVAWPLGLLVWLVLDQRGHKRAA